MRGTRKYTAAVILIVALATPAQAFTFNTRDGEPPQFIKIIRTIRHWLHIGNNDDTIVVPRP